RQTQQLFPEALGEVSLDDFVFAINDVQPSYIRVEADEATYNMHIILRFELEQALVQGDLKPADVPAAWDEKFAKAFSLKPPTEDRTGQSWLRRIRRTRCWFWSHSIAVARHTNTTCG